MWLIVHLNWLRATLRSECLNSSKVLCGSEQDISHVLTYRPLLRRLHFLFQHFCEAFAVKSNFNRTLSTFEIETEI